MADLRYTEREILEQVFEMGSGFFLNFSNNSLADWFQFELGIDIYHEQYDFRSGSKANRIRKFWTIEKNWTVAKFIDLMLTYMSETIPASHQGELFDRAREVANRLRDSIPVGDIPDLSRVKERDGVSALLSDLHVNIKSNPASALDRLHTLCVHYFRDLLEGAGGTVDKEKPLHSISGELIRKLLEDGSISTHMSERIAKANLSILQEFSSTRNNQSLAHANPLPQDFEAEYLVSSVIATLRFFEGLRGSLAERNQDDLPF